MNESRQARAAQVERRLELLRVESEALGVQASFVDRVMEELATSEREFSRMLTRAARRCAGVCAAAVLVAVWWAVQSQGLAGVAYVATESPLEAAW